ncbi:hypothetical protein Lesp02_29850 [Lentzea sp. NBRC 105346]|nr:hypothetical protein Lesp02_29850 [Lentzea sp. NBRC 105346]
MRAIWDQHLLEKAKEEPGVDVVAKYGTGETIDEYQSGLSETLARERLARLLEADAAAEAAQRIIGDTPGPGDIPPPPGEAGPMPPAQPE